jgi:hypothetical protein
VELLEYVIGEDDRDEEEAVREERVESRVDPGDRAAKGVYGNGS